VRYTALESIFRTLTEAGVRFLVVGGVAVNAHGYQRLTADLDLTLAMDEENILAALRALGALGYTPALPVSPEALADADTRRRWHDERNLEVFSLISSEERKPTVDILVREPFPFDREHQRALVAELAPGLEVPFVALDTLIAMKERTGRRRDEDDVHHLRWILEEQGGEGD
jgi:hypothetical protein